MTLKEMKELARKAWLEKNKEPVEDLTGVANKGSKHDARKLQEVKDDETRENENRLSVVDIDSRSSSRGSDGLHQALTNGVSRCSPE